MLYSVGAIERAKLEDDDLHISYESLVDDLDVGDSFTTQLIEVLVKVCGVMRFFVTSDSCLF